MYCPQVVRVYCRLARQARHSFISTLFFILLQKSKFQFSQNVIFCWGPSVKKASKYSARRDREREKKWKRINKKKISRFPEMGLCDAIKVEESSSTAYSNSNQQTHAKRHTSPPSCSSSSLLLPPSIHLSHHLPRKNPTNTSSPSSPSSLPRQKSFAFPSLPSPPSPCGFWEGCFLEV